MNEAETKGRGINRRRFLKSGAAAMAGSAVFGAAPGWLRSSAWAGSGEGLEKTKLAFGIIPLTDCAVLVVAAVKGYFKKYGLDVAITKEASWANIRDKVAIGALDGAHMLAGMPIASTLGVGAVPKATITAFSMDLNGNGITVSNELYARMREADPEATAEHPTSARALKKVIDADKAAGKPPMTFAMVFPVSTHNYEIRYWMGSAGIDPDRDVRLIVIPPSQMVENLRANNIVGYCVGEPWNERAVKAGLGRTLITNHDIWNNSPEKVFGVNLEWAEKYPNTHKAVIKALLEAAQWMDMPENRMEVVGIISQEAYVNAPVDVVKMSMTGTFQYAIDEAPQPMPDFNVFYRYAATYPWLSHAEWFITQMYRWGQLDKPLDIKKAAASIYRPDIYRAAADEIGVAYPTIEHKREGVNDKPWVLTDATVPIEMGRDLYFDGGVFDPSALMAYINGFTVKKPKVDISALAARNV